MADASDDGVHGQRGTDSEKVVGRSRFNPALLNALSSFRVEPKSGWLWGAKPPRNCSGPVSVLATDTATCCGGPATAPTCNAQNPEAAAKRDSAATTARADWRRGLEGLPAPRKLTVLPP